MTTAELYRNPAREYELVYILKPQVSADDAEKIAARIQEVVTKLGGKITRVDVWGRRKLAYTIQKFTRGVYVYVRLVGYGDVVAEIERNLRNADSVIRFQTVRKGDATFDLAKVVVNPDEATFTKLELPADEEVDPTFEETLGLTGRSRDRNREQHAAPPVEEQPAEPSADAATPAATEPTN